MHRSPPSLEGITLEQILLHLVGQHGWEGLGKIIEIRCFNSAPSITSSLKFLRKTPWARKKVEELYKDRGKYVRSMGNSPYMNGAQAVINVIEKYIKQ